MLDYLQLVVISYDKRKLTNSFFYIIWLLTCREHRHHDYKQLILKRSQKPDINLKNKYLST